MYLYIVEITDDREETTFFGPFRSEANADVWAQEEIKELEDWAYTTYPLLDPHYTNDAD